jgi:uncharacterized protein (TIGR02246 family)
MTMRVARAFAALLALALALALAPQAAPSLAADASPDDAAIRALEQQQADTWNRHDAHAYVQLFTDDADVVNVLGWWWRGRPTLEARLAQAFSFVFKDSRLTITEVTIRYLTPDIAVAHVRWTMTGAKSPDGSTANIPQQGIQTQVLRKQDGVWRIIVFQNTNSVPERPFPQR